MDDLISRKAVKELAHNQVREKYCGAALKGHRDFYIKLADSIIDLLPSAQPEIIRCKDCKKREHCRTTNTWAVAPSDDWYCADAERRTDG